MTNAAALRRARRVRPRDAAGLLLAALLAVLSAAVPAAPAFAAPAGYPVTGIDVSAFQGSINWPSVVTSGVRFTYIRASEQANIPDAFFDVNYTAAKSNGLYVGAYHRARPTLSGGRAQATYFLDHARYVNDGRTLPPMLDIEWPRSNWGEGTCYGMTPTQLVAWIRDFVNEVTIRTGRHAMIYTNPNWWAPCTNNNATFGSYPLFNSGYLPSPPPLPAGWTRWTLWQYTSSLSVPGISGPVDGDVFNGTPAELAALAGSEALNDSTSFADLNADRRAEMVTLWAGSPPQVYGYLNVNGFGPIDRNQYAFLASGFRTGTTQFADLDADGRAEIITFWAGPPTRVYAYRNVNGFGPYVGSQYTYLGSGFEPATTQFADLNNDGRAEIITWLPGTPPRVYAYLNVNGFGAYDGNRYAHLATGFQPASTRFADLNNDGRAEIMAFYGGTTPTVNAYLNVNGFGPYDGSQYTYLGAGFRPATTKFADLNGDGRAEIITFLLGAAGSVWAYHNVNGYGPYDGSQYTVVGSGFRP